MFNRTSGVTAALQNTVKSIIEVNTTIPFERYTNLQNGAVAFQVPIDSAEVNSLINGDLWKTKAKNDMPETAEELVQTVSCGMEKEIIEAYKDVGYSSHEDDNAAAYFSPLFNTFDDSILTVDRMQSIEECIDFAVQLKQKVPNLWGVTAVTGDGEALNLFHPLTAMSIMSNLDKFEGKRYKLLIYTMRIEDLPLLHSKYRTFYADVQKMVDNIATLLKVYQQQVEGRSITRISEVKSERFSVQITTQEASATPEGRAFMVAVQFMTRGIMIPYYGTALVLHLRDKHNYYSVKGYNVSPFHSCNLNPSTTNYNKELLNYGSVCTGNKDPKTFAGLKTLTHANLNSAYTTSIIEDGALVYAKLCLDTSEQIYKIKKDKK